MNKDSLCLRASRLTYLYSLIALSLLALWLGSVAGDSEYLMVNILVYYSLIFVILLLPYATLSILFNPLKYIFDQNGIKRHHRNLLWRKGGWSASWDDVNWIRHSKMFESSTFRWEHIRLSVNRTDRKSLLTLY